MTLFKKKLNIYFFYFFLVYISKKILPLQSKKTVMMK